MCQAVEEAISLRYMLHCLGIPVTDPTNLYGDNFGLIQSASIPDSEMKKKHVAISYSYHLFGKQLQIRLSTPFGCLPMLTSRMCV